MSGRRGKVLPRSLICSCKEDRRVRCERGEGATCGKENTVLNV